MPSTTPVTRPFRTTSASGAIAMRRRAADDELVDLGEGARAARRLAMIDFAEQNVGRALQRRSVGRHVGRHAGMADETSVGLRVKIKAVAAQGHERHARRHLAVARIELLQKRAAAVIFAAERPIDGEDAVIGRAAEDRLGDARRVGCDIAARRIAAARQRDDRDFRRAGPGFDAVDERGQFAQLVLRRGTVGLSDGVVVARLRVSEIDRKQTVSRIAVALEPPDRRLPDPGRVAVAMHEDDRNRRLILSQRRSMKRGEREGGRSLQHAAAVQH